MFESTRLTPNKRQCWLHCHQQNLKFSFFDQRRRAGVKGRVTTKQCTSTRKEAVSVLVLPDAVQKRINGHNLSDILFYLYFEDSEYWLLKCRMFYIYGSKMISNRQANDVGSYSEPPLNRYANN